MRKLLAFLGVCVLAVSGSAWAQVDYLIKLDDLRQFAIDRIKTTEIEIFAKTMQFWVAGASKKNLDFLAEGGIAFQILDQEPEIGEHYLILSKPSEEIEVHLPTIEAKSEVLFTEKNMALVKGIPKNIEELILSGLGLRKIHKRPLPLESKTDIPSYLGSLSPEYDPLIDTIVNQVDQTQILSWIDDLTGEDTVFVAGAEDSIKTRYSYSDGIFKAAHYLKERFEEMGLWVELDTFQLRLPGGDFMDVACSPDGQKAWSVSYYGGIVRTSDGGDSWSIVEGSETLELYNIFRVDDDTLWAVGDSGNIIRSTDGGGTWEGKSKPEFSVLNFRGSYFEDAHHGWVVGDEKVLFTSDGGATWVEQEQVDSIRLHGIDFTDSLLGWAVGQNGTVLHTTNRGENWIPQPSGTSAYFTGVDFVDSLNGWAIAYQGWPFYTTDGGASWIQADLPDTTNLRGIDFADSLHGWIVGSDGSIYCTSDLGVNWISQPSNSNYLVGVDFADTLIGWASGHFEIIKTTDGGESWLSQYQNVEPYDLLNVVATLDGQVHPGRQVLITGHYDDLSEDPHYWAPGADDNASGTVSLLAAASILKDYNLLNTVKFVAFGAEEQGLIGSAAYAEEAYNRGDTILGVLNFDMIAWDGDGDDTIEVHCGAIPESNALADLFIGAISDYGLSLNPKKIADATILLSDQVSFWDYDYPGILGIENYLGDFNPYYHSTSDRVSAFDTAYYVDFTKAAVAGISILGDPFLLGDANADGVTDIADVMYLINYLFISGSAPDPLTAGDANCDGVVDVADVTYLINYLFIGGSPPGCD